MTLTQYIDKVLYTQLINKHLLFIKMKHRKIDYSFFDSMPEGIIANVMVRTTPRDVCVLSVVCSVFRSVAEWDAVWETFLPDDYHNLLPGSDGVSKKELYLWLCDHPVLVEDGNKSMGLDKSSGKICYMLAARALWIVWGDTPDYWKWISTSDTRFDKVAGLIQVCWLEVHGSIHTSVLSTNTWYAAYLVYILVPNAFGFEYEPTEVSISLYGNHTLSQPKRVFFYNLESQTPPDVPKPRQDGWSEIELGDFYNKEGSHGKLDMKVKGENGTRWKSGLIIQGIEFRPKPR